MSESILPITAKVKSIHLNGRLVPTNPLTPWDVTHLVKCGSNELKIAYYGSYSWSDMVVVPLLPVDFNFFSTGLIAKAVGKCWASLGVTDWLNWPKGEARSVLRHDDVSFSMYSVLARPFLCKSPVNALVESLPDIGITPPNPVASQPFQVEFSRPLGASSYTATAILVNPAQYSGETRLEKVLGSGVAAERTVLVFSLPVDSNLEWLVRVVFDTGEEVEAAVLNYGRFFADSDFTPLAGSVGAGFSCSTECEPADSTGECLDVFSLGGVQVYSDCESCANQRLFYINWDTNTSERGVDSEVFEPVANRWVITDEGYKIRFNIEDSFNCGGPNRNIQAGQATATIQTGDRQVIMGLDFEGVVEYQDAGFENISFKLDGLNYSNVTLAMATSFGNSQGCTSGPMRQEDIIRYLDPPYLLAANQVYTFTIDFTTSDNLYHVGCYYQVNLSFVQEGSDGGNGQALPTPSVPPVVFSTPQVFGSSNALVLYVMEYSTGDNTPSGEYVAEVDINGLRTGTWAKVGSDRFGIIANGDLSEIVDYTLESEVLYSLSNPLNSNPDAVNLGVYSKVNGNAKRAVVTDVRP